MFFPVQKICPNWYVSAYIFLKNYLLCLFSLWSFFSLLFFFPSLFLIFLGLVTLKPGPALASTTWIRQANSVSKSIFSSLHDPKKNYMTRLTWFQFFLEPWGSFFHLFTSNTQALQMSPTRSSDNLNISMEQMYTKLKTKQTPYSHAHEQQCTHDCNTNELLPKTQPERLLISTAVCEAWTGGLGFADTTAVVTPVDLWLVKAKHTLSLGQCVASRKEPWKK